ncbi:uncharacterized protein B0T15DRAFT_506780 [Chaetomium strumarium]|uniref:Uncharacterized protein n=1 Tax=Chaetomium strumarium TaxID=1170767 RepID=A0AAJ0M5Q2_9PEZI|nr:hypothetical protein B0T15DRAFT_506780 [Chaetomium strumarium]
MVSYLFGDEPGVSKIVEIFVVVIWLIDSVVLFIATRGIFSKIATAFFTSAIALNYLVGSGGTGVTDVHQYAEGNHYFTGSAAFKSHVMPEYDSQERQTGQRPSLPWGYKAAYLIAKWTHRMLDSLNPDECMERDVNIFAH